MMVLSRRHDVVAVCVTDPREVLWSDWLGALDRLAPALAIDAYDWVTNNHSRAGLADRWERALAPVLPA